MTIDDSMTIPLPRWFLPEVCRLIEKAVSELASSKSPTAQPEVTSFSANQAARQARRRRADVAAAIESGALKANRRGSRYVISGASLNAWIEAGCPTGLEVAQ